jgi:hypothetical protein
MRFSRITGVLAATATLAAAVTIPAGIASADTPTGPGAQIASTAHASTTPTPHAGVYMYAKGARWWVGSLNVRENGQNAIAICVIPGAALLTPTSVRTGVYGTERQSAELDYVMASWGVSPSGSVAAGARLAMLKITGRSIPGLQVPARIAAYAANDLLNAERYAGPDTASVVFGGKPTTPGQAGSVKMDVISKTGHEVPGIPVRFTPGSASLAANGHSGEWEKFTRTSPAPVRVSGTAAVTSDEVTIGTAPHGQTLISASPASVKAGNGYQASPAPVKATVACNCDGTGNITGHVSQAAGAAEGQYAMLVNGKAVATVTVLASRHAAAGVLKATAPDGAVVTFTARYKVGGKWTAPIGLGGTYKVVCPVTPTAKCLCATGGSGYAQALTLVNSSPFAETVNWDAAGTAGSMTVPAGASKTVTVPLKPHQMIAYSGTVHAGKVTATTPVFIAGTR